MVEPRQPDHAGAGKLGVSLGDEAIALLAGPLDDVSAARLERPTGARAGGRERDRRNRHRRIPREKAPPLAVRNLRESARREPWGLLRERRAVKAPLHRNQRADPRDD